MLPIPDLNLGFNDAENYKKKSSKELFGKFFFRNASLDKLCEEQISFLIGEKGTGKTAYGVYLENSDYRNINGSLKYIRETEYQKFVQLKKSENLELSDYVSIWKVILYLLLSKQIISSQDKVPFLKMFSPFRELNAAIDEFYASAFAPEIITALQFVEGYEYAAQIIATNSSNVGAAVNESLARQEKKFQTNLLFIENKFENALKSLKLDKNFLLLIDGIDVRPNAIEYEDYLDCVKGLANAIWYLNNDIFANIKDSQGRLRCVLLIRPDIFESIGFQNRNSKIKENSVLLDWKTTYPEYRNSEIFQLVDRMLLVQQDEDVELGESWDYYFPFDTVNVTSEIKFPSSFVGFLRFSLFRPRDVITMITIMQDLFVEKKRSDDELFSESDFENPEFRRRYSEYLLGEIKDHLSFYYTDEDYENFLKFFEFLNGKSKFDYREFVSAYSKFTDFIDRNDRNLSKFCESQDTFLQFLYDLNILCFIEDTDERPFISWCHRDRSPSNISPKVKTHRRYQLHYGIMKGLNLGKEFSSGSYDYSGRVLWYNKRKGFGFIAQSDGADDIFVHASALDESGIENLTENQIVSFDIAPGKDGRLQARNIRSIEQKQRK